VVKKGAAMDRYNSEGYPDPTVAVALTNVTREVKAARQYNSLVYIASPFAGDMQQNIERARRYCRYAVGRGRIPLAPHLIYPQFMDDEDKEQRELGLRFALRLLGKCDELWVFGDKISEGMSREIAKAKKRGIPISYFNNSCQFVKGDEGNA
jgi:hypothetical protein